MEYFNYVVTAYVRDKGRVETISKPMSKAKATSFAKREKDLMKISIDKYKFFTNIRIKKIK